MKRVAEPLTDRTLKAALEADYVTFTSSSTVENFLAAAGIAGERRGFLLAADAHRLDRARHERDARASMASSRTSRPSATTSTG